jgi:hypothetical protein
MYINLVLIHDRHIVSTILNQIEAYLRSSLGTVQHLYAVEYSLKIIYLYQMKK